VVPRFRGDERPRERSCCGLRIEPLAAKDLQDGSANARCNAQRGPRERAHWALPDEELAAELGELSTIDRHVEQAMIEKCRDRPVEELHRAVNLAAMLTREHLAVGILPHRSAPRGCMRDARGLTERPEYLQTRLLDVVSARA